FPLSPPDFARPTGELRLGKPASSPHQRSLSRRSGAAAKADFPVTLRSPYGRASSWQAGELTRRRTLSRRLVRRSCVREGGCPRRVRRRTADHPFAKTRPVRPEF